MPMKVCISAPIWLTKHTRRIIIRTISTEIWGRRISLRRLQEPTPWTPVLFYAFRCAPHGAPRSALAKTPCADGAVRSLFLMPALVRARRGGRRLSGGARRACAPVRHSQQQPCCAHSLFLLPTPFCALCAEVWAKEKQPLTGLLLLVGAGGRTRTDTDFTPQDFESSASASFTTPAQLSIYHGGRELTSTF